MGDVRALTLYPEHAALFVAGIRSIETRSKPTRYRGRLLLHAGARDPWSAPAQRSPRTRAALDKLYDLHGIDRGLVYGAVVASANLVACAPVEHAYIENPATGEYDVLTSITARDPDDHDRVWFFSGDDAERDAWWVDARDQLAFGDFSEGRSLWVLDDVKPTTERCPRCWGEGWLRLPRWKRDGEPCRTCSTAGVCEPVPMRGRQGLWIPSWEAFAV